MEERRIWCAAILQAIDDAINPRVSAVDKKDGSVTTIDQETARAWLTSPSRDLQDVCDLADVPFSMVLLVGNNLAQRQWRGTKTLTTMRQRISQFMSGTTNPSSPAC